MKGFFSFILLFALLVLIIHSLSFTSNYQNNELIQIERIYQLELNLKESIVEGTKQGAIEGLSIYLLTQESFNLNTAEMQIKISINEKLSSLNSISKDFPDFEFILWCGDPYDFELKDLRTQMIEKNEIQICSDCKELENLNCIDLISPEFITNVNQGELPILSSINLGNRDLKLGISIYSKKFQISSILLIPEYEVHLIETI